MTCTACRHLRRRWLVLVRVQHDRLPLQLRPQRAEDGAEIRDGGIDKTDFGGHAEVLLVPIRYERRAEMLGRVPQAQISTQWPPASVRFRTLEQKNSCLTFLPGSPLALMAYRKNPSAPCCSPHPRAPNVAADPRPERSKPLNAASTTLVAVGQEGSDRCGTIAPGALASNVAPQPESSTASYSAWGACGPR